MTEPEAEMSDRGTALGEELAYEPNWYRVLKALSIGQPVDVEFAEPTSGVGVLTRVGPDRYELLRLPG
jgi:hypothetical protein